MERLTERELNSVENVSYCKCFFKDCDGNCQRCELQYEADMKLKHYEDLEEQGLLLKLPCKVGDIIYSIGTLCDFGETEGVICDTIDCEKCFHGDKLVIRERVAKKFHIIRFLEGRSQHDFLTKEEAEAKLKELENE